MEYLIVFMFGAIMGSFLNVCIYRLPLGKSIVTPRSFCPFCEKTIRWYDNIPLISYVLLLGKCRHCKQPITLRYVAVELITALLSVGLFYYFSLSAEFFVYWAFVSSLIVVTFIDIEHQEIPDEISIPGIFLGVLAMTFLKLGGSGSYLPSFINSSLGILAGGGSMFLLGMAGELIFKKEALGGGDVKLMAMIGAFLGWKLVILTFFMAPFFGSIVGMYMKVRHKREIIAYGPYLSLSSIICLIYGNDILKYLFGH
ncbi:MAG: prepilin peptidase [Candidatus Aadella gelida]|nr:prepilin peptidase [Candidatus Aadella gelida]